MGPQTGESAAAKTSEERINCSLWQRVTWGLHDNPAVRRWQKIAEEGHRHVFMTGTWELWVWLFPIPPTHTLTLTPFRDIHSVYLIHKHLKWELNCDYCKHWSIDSHCYQGRLDAKDSKKCRTLSPRWCEGCSIFRNSLLCWGRLWVATEYKRSRVPMASPESHLRTTS